MDNARMKNVSTQYLKVPEYKRTDAGSSQHHLVGIREHSVACPVFDLMTPKDEDESSVSELPRKDDIF